jgi:hypothetical protein
MAFGFHGAGKAHGILESAVRLRRMSIYKSRATPDHGLKRSFSTA